MTKLRSLSLTKIGSADAVDDRLGELRFFQCGGELGLAILHDVERRHHALCVRFAGPRVRTHLRALLVVDQLAMLLVTARDPEETKLLFRLPAQSAPTLIEVTLRPMPR